MAALLLVVAVGFVVSLPALLWGVSDLRRVPAGVWHSTPFGPGPWRFGMIAGYVLGGWPSLLVALCWRLSSERANVRREWRRLTGLRGED